MFGWLPIYYVIHKKLESQIKSSNSNNRFHICTVLWVILYMMLASSNGEIMYDILKWTCLIDQSHIALVIGRVKERTKFHTQFFEKSNECDIWKEWESCIKCLSFSRNYRSYGPVHFSWVLDPPDNSFGYGPTRMFLIIHMGLWYRLKGKWQL